MPGIKNMNIALTEEQHFDLTKAKTRLARKLGKDDLTWAEYMLATIKLVKDLDGEDKEPAQEDKDQVPDQTQDTQDA